MKKLILILIIVLVVLLGCKLHREDFPGVESDLIKNSITENGVAVFVDNQTGEEVNIYVEDKDQNGISEINVTFWDGGGYEVFILDDPSGKYFSAFEIYPHNSDHTITMYIAGDSLIGTIENIEVSSDKGEAMEKFVAENENKKEYMGRFTPEQIDKVTSAKLNIIKPLGGGDFKKFASELSDLKEKIEEIFGINEPEFFDVFMITPGGITSSIRWLEPVEKIGDYPNAVVDTMNMEYKPYDIAITPDGQYAYVTNCWDDTVSVIRISDGAVVSIIDVGGWPQKIAITPDGQYAYVVNNNNDTVSVIRTSDGIVIDVIRVGDYPVDIEITSNGQYVYVVNYYEYTISIIRISDNIVVDTIDAGIPSTDIIITPDGQYIYAENNDPSDTVSVIRTSDGAVINTIGVGHSPNCIAITPDGQYAYVTNCWDDTVSVIRTSDGVVVNTIGVGNFPEDVEITPDGQYAYVANSRHYSDHIPPANTVSVIRISDNIIVDTINVGDYPSQIAITPDGQYVYVTNLEDMSISVIGIR